MNTEKRFKMSFIVNALISAILGVVSSIFTNKYFIEKSQKARSHSEVLNKESLKQWIHKINDILEWDKNIRYQYSHETDAILPNVPIGLNHIPHNQSLISHMESGYKKEWNVWNGLEKDVKKYFEEKVSILELIRYKLREKSKSFESFEYYHKPGAEQPLNFVDPIRIAETTFREIERRLAGFEIEWFAENFKVDFFMNGDLKVWVVPSSSGSLVNDTDKEKAEFIHLFLTTLVRSHDLQDKISSLINEKKKIDIQLTEFREALRKISSTIDLGNNIKGKCEYCP